MLIVTAEVQTTMRLEHQPPQSLVALSVNGTDCGLLNVPAEQADELVGVLNAAVDMREALDVIPPDKLESLATWFDVQQAKRPELRGTSRELQGDLRKMARLSRVALAKAKGGAG